MKTRVLTDLQKLSLDVYKGKVKKYSVEEGQEAIRKAIMDACGGEWNFYNFQKNKWDVYALISEVLSVALGEILVDQFNEFAEVKDTALGDQPVFTIKDTSLFRVATIANGNTDIRRQKLYGSTLTVPTEKLAIKIYEELDMFLAGRIDWADMVTRVTLSYGHDIGTRIYNAIYNSYSALSAPYAQTGVYAADTLATLIAHVQAGTGQVPVVYGTKKALGKITDANPSERMKDELNLMGHFGYFQGTALLELPQAHKPGTSTFAVDDSFLLVVPNGEKIVKLVLEGDAYVYDTEPGTRNDEQIEFFFGRRAGVSAITARIYGLYRLS